jgi:hypothetical protein
VGYYAARGGNFLETFRETLTVVLKIQSSRFKLTLEDGSFGLPLNVGKILPLRAKKTLEDVTDRLFRNVGKKFTMFALH